MQTAGLSFGSRGVGTTKGEQEISQENGGGGGEIEIGREGERDTQFVIAFFAVLNPLEMEVFHINMHCIIPSRRANCFL